MKIEVDLKELLKLISDSIEKRNERITIAIPVGEVTKECYDAYTKGRRTGFTQGVETAIKEIRKVTGILEEEQ